MALVPLPPPLCVSSGDSHLLSSWFVSCLLESASKAWLKWFTWVGRGFRFGGMLLPIDPEDRANQGWFP